MNTRTPQQVSNPISEMVKAKVIAVIGASRDPSKVGHQILRNLLLNQKISTIPVNPQARSILRLRCSTSIQDIEDLVDIAIIAVPVTFVASVIDECIAKKVKSVIVITAGFAELSGSGKKLQAEIVEKLKQANIALLGPNTLGLIAPHQNLNASFAPAGIPAGNLAFISQSGAMLSAVFSEMQTSRQGCSFAISLGNKAGLSEIEALEYAGSDPKTKVIGLYLESFSNLPKFFELASKISKIKPVILLKGGMSKRGQTASLSHTAALATNTELLKSAESQIGFVLVDTIEEFVQSCFFLGTLYTLPTNVMIMTNAGGPGVNTTDLVASAQIELAQWTTSTADHIKEILPLVHPSNPLDLLGDAQTDRFQFAIECAQRDPKIDSVLLVLTQQAVTNIGQIVDMLIAKKGKKPVTVALIGGDYLEPHRQKLRAANILCTDYPNEIVDVLRITSKIAKAKLLSHTHSIKKVAPEKTQTHNFSLDEAFTLLKTYNFSLPRYEIITKLEQVKNVTLPAFVKTANLSLKHKKSLGAIAGKVVTLKEAQNAYQALSKFGNAVLFQELVDPGLELILGANLDPQFGMYIAMGLGGSQTNILQDRSYIFTPANRNITKSAFEKTKAFKFLKEAQHEYLHLGLLDKWYDFVAQLQRLTSDHPEIAELEINPVIVNKKGLWVADIKISLKEQ